MRILTVAVIVAGIAALPVSGHAATTKKHHRWHRPVAVVQGPVQGNLNYFGNAAAAGNNANSMSGDNSAGENANGRTSGSGFR
jgi:hypothetical protein